MREGELYSTRHHPTFMRMNINMLKIGYNGILLIFAGALGCSLHRQCTVMDVPLRKELAIIR